MNAKVSAEKEHRNLRLKGVARLIAYLKRRRRKYLGLKKLGRWWWWIWPTMQLADLPYLGRLFTRLAGLPLGHYVNKKPLARIKTYVSPKAQIDCPNLHLGRKCFVDDFVTIFGHDGDIKLGKSVHLYRGTIIEAGKGGKVIIGDHTHIFANCNLNGYGGEVRIGNHVMIAAHCGFTPYQHKLDDVSQRMSAQKLTSKGNIIIEDDVWLGMGVKVMDGVHIGRGAVVGANAVVTKDIPPYSVAVGVPAQVVRKRKAEQ